MFHVWMLMHGHSTVLRDVDCYWTWYYWLSQVAWPQVWGILPSPFPQLWSSRCVGVVCVIFKHGFWGSRLWCSGLGNKTLPAEPSPALECMLFLSRYIYGLFMCMCVGGHVELGSLLCQSSNSGLQCWQQVTHWATSLVNIPTLTFFYSFLFLRQVVVQPGIEPMMSSVSATPTLEAPWTTVPNFSSTQCPWHTQVCLAQSRLPFHLLGSVWMLADTDDCE